MDSMKPAAILKKYFGLKDEENNAQFIGEIRELKEWSQREIAEGREDHYKWMVSSAAAELGVTPDFG